MLRTPIPTRTRAQPSTTEPADPASPEAASTETSHRSLQLTPPPFDPDRARPRATVYVHLSAEALTAGAGITRIENIGPVLLARLHTVLGDHCTINLKPVIDLPAGHSPIDAYEIPASLREQVLLRNPADVFPYAAALTRPIDIDHTIPYLHPDRGGPPGQTSIGNLGLRFPRFLGGDDAWFEGQAEGRTPCLDRLLSTRWRFGSGLWRWLPPRDGRSLRSPSNSVSTRNAAQVGAAG